jgi:Asp/Glu/hydantoin racemase
MPRIALIHAVTVAMQPIQDAFASGWPEARLMNLLDDSLSPDRAKSDALTAEMSGRIAELGRYALRCGADGILYTCSAFGPAIAAFSATTNVPVLKPNEAMFTQALSLGKQIGMLATFGPSVASMNEEFEEAAAGSGARIEIILIEEAMRALKQGDTDSHNRMLAEAAPRLSHCDVIMLAHFSTSRALKAVGQVVKIPVLASPDSAVAALRQRCR